MGVAFAFSMYLETQASRQFVATTQARYVAEAGISHARALLDEDRLGSRTDDLSEPWAQRPLGHDADADGDGTSEARWWTVASAGAGTAGRYAVALTDESGKVNLNAAEAEPSPVGVGAVNLTTLLQSAGIGNAAAAAQAIEAYRNGPDERPGRAGIDDDGDGAIDEPDEYQPLILTGDDRRIDNLEDLAAVTGWDADDLRRVSRLATVYSWDLNAAVTGKPRVNVNTATADELLSVLLDSGAEHPWQAAVNLADDADADVEMSRVTKSSQLVLLADQGPLGGWSWNTGSGGYYESAEPGSAALLWVTPVPAGTFRLLARGVSGTPIGDVSVAGQLKRSVEPGESLGQFELSGTVTVEVVNREPPGTSCAFRGLELVSETAVTGVVVRGIEAVRFNELMVEPTMSFDVSTAAFEAQGSDWGCPLDRPACSNSGVGQARWSWTDEHLPAGRYHVRVFGGAAGQTVGEVKIGSESERLVHGQSHSASVQVGSDGKFSLTIGKSAAEQTYYLKSATLSLEPDGEYVELMNLSEDALEVGGWLIEGELTGGRQARLPAGSTIAPHGLLVAAVDLDDTQETVAGDGVSARAAWGIAPEANAVQLEFLAGAPTRDDDWLKTAVGSGVNRLILRRDAVVVDEAEYPLPLPTTAAFQSIEKGDPTVIVDQDLDGLDEGWYPSLQLYTPGLPNDNNGLRELVGLEVVTHDPAEEVTVLNRPLRSVGELAGLPSGNAWQPFSSSDLAKIADRLTIEGLKLEAEGRLTAGDAAWQEKTQGYYEYSSLAQPPVTGTWRWTAIPDGHYRLSLYGWPGEQLSVRWEQQSGVFTEWSPALSSDAQGRVVIGQVAVGVDDAPANTLTLEAACGSPSGVCHLDYVRLDPRLVRLGPVNVNTAPREVLLALPGMTGALADRIIAGRPYGDRHQKGRGIGDLLWDTVLGSDEEEKLGAFRRLAHLLTVRSEVFQIIGLGQAVQDGQARAVQRITAVVQR
jgi:type II secretory pathway component PulK